MNAPAIIHLTKACITASNSPPAEENSRRRRKRFTRSKTCTYLPKVRISQRPFCLWIDNDHFDSRQDLKKEMCNPCWIIFSIIKHTGCSVRAEFHPWTSQAGIKQARTGTARQDQVMDVFHGSRATQVRYSGPEYVARPWFWRIQLKNYRQTSLC